MNNNGDWNNLDQELQELSAEFEEFGFSGANLSAEEFTSFTELDELVEATGLDEDEFEAMSLDALADSPEDVVFTQRFIGRKVPRMLRKLVALIRRYGSRLKSCVPLVNEAIKLYRRRKWFACLRKCYQAFQCIRNALS